MNPSQQDKPETTTTTTTTAAAPQPPEVQDVTSQTPAEATNPSSDTQSNAAELHTTASSSGDDPQFDDLATPTPFPAWSTASETPLGHASTASDIGDDRVFPIRSVVRVDTSTNLTSGDESFPHLSDTDSRGPGIPVHFLGGSRVDLPSELRRVDSGPLSPISSSLTSGDRLPPSRKKRAFSGPYSSVQADAARKGSIAPLPLKIHVNSSDREDDESDGAAVTDSQSTSQHSDGLSMADIPHIATRFNHVVTEDGHAIITGRDGTLQRCEDEPIHTPGAVQGFGVLLAMREETDGRFVIRYVSENAEKLLGHTPQQLFRLKSFLDILTEEQQDNLLDHIDFIRDEDADPAVNGPEVFSLSVRVRKQRRSSKLWCAIHINPAHPDLIICEFEKDDDEEYPLHPTDELTPETPHDSLHSNPTLEEIEESTEVLSKPLRILRSARKKRGEQGAMQVFDIMSQVQEQLASAADLQTFLKVLVGIVKELTGFHRVMMYQFDSSFNGKVVAELVDTSKTVDLYHGLHFPASDIPRQARELYKINKVRLLYDRDLQTARVVCRTREDLVVPLDMSHAYLRAMSPIHLKYLGHMGVRASMSISINAFSELWGLVACHSYGPHGMRVSFPIRKMCRLVGDTASRNIERLSYASRLQARKLINTAPTDKNPTGYIIASSEDLLRLFDADFGLLSIKGETKILGVIEQSQEALAMLEYLRMRRLTSVVASQDVREDFPDLQYAPGFQIIAGLLYVPLSVGGSDFIVFFRRGQVKEVKWAGNPYEKVVREGTDSYLEPRTSFKIWHETVVGKCREWIEEQVETAAVLCLVYGKFIEVWRQKEAALQSSKLTRILLANSAHEVRTPLNAIINYLEIALEGSLDHETRENLAKSHSASKSLIYVINDLLDLTKTEEGQHLIKFEIFELPSCVKEATDPFRIDAERKGIGYEVNLHPGLPRFVHGDGRRVRQAISNITANAVAHTTTGYVKVDMFVSEVRDQEAVIEIVVTDSGAGMNPKQLDALFRELEQVSTEEPDPALSPDHKTPEVRTLGLGLAVVARIVRNMDGQLRLKSLEGQGSRFVVQLPFQLPEETSEVSEEGETISKIAASDKDAVSTVESLTNAPEGEILLVDASGININLEGDRSSVEGEVLEAVEVVEVFITPLGFNDKEHDYFAPRISKAQSASFATGSDEAQSRKQSLEVPRRSYEEPGTAEIRDSKTPVRAIKVPDEYTPMPAQPNSSGEQSQGLYEVRMQRFKSPQIVTSVTTGDTRTSLRILVAEDDPINLKILKKRLERAGHEVHHAVNGEDCATMYREKSSAYDVVLMDMQMPIVDGLTSTKMIRAMEKTPEHVGHSPLSAICDRIPIFAVSASLVEKGRETYIDAGFDGWILKPVDFKRLSTLLEGIQEDETRNACLYAPGEWERGGWFGSHQTSSQTYSEDGTTPKAEGDNTTVEISVDRIEEN
ncbi:Cyanobacterial phytochrome B-like protein [Cladobotryum mycophilum]|uniref:Cyanobacterial phytochrome B-like protein n=1 Tax=Cladobotryum mycophilum TaxID=491253 RepID=A0ABR0SST7_9HYPO